MRITCPSCTSHFEIPTALLGKKGRALKCASCGHSWYQTAQVESMDIASIMGEEYAAQAQAAAGAVQMRNAISPAAAAVGGAQRAQAAAGAQRAQVAPLGAGANAAPAGAPP